jgi:hypothetical protein
MGHPQAYGVFHYLDDSLLDDYSFPVKKLHHKTISHLFSRVDDIRGHKDNMCAAKKTTLYLLLSREAFNLCRFN